MPRRLLFLLLSCVLSGLPAASAQQQSGSGSNADSENTTETAATAAEPDEEPEDNDPFDYEASEEISEDLSVSFPVDI